MVSACPTQRAVCLGSARNRAHNVDMRRFGLLLLSVLMVAPAAHADPPRPKPKPAPATCTPFTDPRGDAGRGVPGGLVDDIDVVRADSSAAATMFAATIGMAAMPQTTLPGDRSYRFAFRVNGRRYVGLQATRTIAGVVEFDVVAGREPGLMAPVEQALGGVFDTAKAEVRMWSDSDLLTFPAGTRLDQFTVTTRAMAPTGLVLAEDVATWSGVVIVGRGCTASRKVVVVVRQ
jgi:hypothetical protein